MKKAIAIFGFLFFISIHLTAQTSILDQGAYYPLNGNCVNAISKFDDNCNTYNAANSYLSCNRGIIDEAGVENGAFQFQNIYSSGSLAPMAGHYFRLGNSFGDFSNGFTIAFSFKGGSRGTVLDATYEDYGYFPDLRMSPTKGFQIIVDDGLPGVTFKCYFGQQGINSGGNIGIVYSNGITGLIPAFVPQVGVWYHVVCRLEQDPTINGGYSRMAIYVNGALKGELTMLYYPTLLIDQITLGTEIRPNISAYNPCYRFGANPTECRTPLYNGGAYHPFNNNPNLIRNQFIGSLDELRIYNKSLDYSEITEVYNARLNSLVPTIRSFTPATAKAGARINVNGKNFTNASNVLFNGTTADSIIVISDTTLTANLANPTNSPDSNIRILTVRVVNDEGIGERYGTVSTITPPAPTPGRIIEGPATACGFAGSDSVISYVFKDPQSANISALTSFQWRVSNTNFIVVSSLTSDTLKVKYKSTFVGGLISCRRIRNGDTLNISLSISKTIPPKPYTIYGNKNICNYVGTSAGTPNRYYIRRLTGAAAYIWTLPIGASIQGGGTSPYTTTDTAINVVFNEGFTSGTLSVRATNLCGDGLDASITLARTNVPLPSAITGSTDVCASMISDSLPAGIPVTYRVRKNSIYTGYSWTVPTNASIVDYPGGFGTEDDTAITVIFDSTFVSGNISVQGVTPCFTTSARNLLVTRRFPVRRIISVTPISLACPNRSIQYNTAPFTYAARYEWTVPSNGAIDGRRDTTQLTVNYSSAASSTGDLIKVRGVNNCGKSLWVTVPVRLTACPATSFAKTILSEMNVTGDFKTTVFPNPTRAEFNIQCSTGSETPISVEVLDAMGNRIEAKQVKANQTFNLGNAYPMGVYLLRIKQNRQMQQLRMVKY